MMVSVHAAVGITSSLFFKRKLDDSISKKKVYAVSFASNIALHGIMDLLPHRHPISGYLDVIISLSTIVILLLIKRKYRILILFCWLGAVMSDIIDLGLFRLLQLGRFRIFPWHYDPVYHFLNTMYKSSFMNMMFDIGLLALCVILVLLNRKTTLRILKRFPSHNP